jgi:hypothetical protein
MVAASVNLDRHQRLSQSFVIFVILESRPYNSGAIRLLKFREKVKRILASNVLGSGYSSSFPFQVHHLTTGNAIP